MSYISEIDDWPISIDSVCVCVCVLTAYNLSCIKLWLDYKSTFVTVYEISKHQGQ